MNSARLPRLFRPLSNRCCEHRIVHRRRRQRRLWRPTSQWPEHHGPRQLHHHLAGGKAAAPQKHVTCAHGSRFRRLQQTDKTLRSTLETNSSLIRANEPSTNGSERTAAEKKNRAVQHGTYTVGKMICPSPRCSTLVFLWCYGFVQARFCLPLPQSQDLSVHTLKAKKGFGST